MASPQSAKVVLIVDDEPRLRTIIRAFLEMENYTVLEADSADQALGVGLTHGGPIDILIADLTLPDGDGRTLARSFRTLRPETRVLIVSGHWGTDETSAELEEHFEFLEKPFTRDSLLRRVQKLVRAANPAA